ncbi:NAD(P)-dependent oxidoreductase [Deltaproteobacteria bacterium TL4]
MRVLLTGAFGNLGRLTTKELLKQGYTVRCFDIATPANEKAAKAFEKQTEIIWGDICNREQVKKAVEQMDAVIHNAGMLPPATDKIPEKAKAVNVGGTQNILEAIQASPKNPALIFTSSVSIFGHRQHLPPPRHISEEPMATDNYTAHKIECERIIQESKVKWCIFRIGAALDVGTKKNDLDIVRDMFEVSPENRMEFVHAEDVALALVNAVKAEEAYGKILLIGGGKKCQIRQKDLFGAVLETLHIRSFPKEAFGNKEFYTDWMDTEESQRILQYQRHTFEEFRQELLAKTRLFGGILWLHQPVLKMGLLYFSSPWRNYQKDKVNSFFDRFKKH